MNKLSYTPVERYTGSFTTLQLYLIDLYIYWINNYISVELLAEHECLSVELCNAMISEGRTLQEQYSSEYKARVKAWVSSHIQHNKK